MSYYEDKTLPPIGEPLPITAERAAVLTAGEAAPAVGVRPSPYQGFLDFFAEETPPVASPPPSRRPTACAPAPLTLTAPLEGRGMVRPAALAPRQGTLPQRRAAQPPPVPEPAAVDHAAFNHPILGGKVTICALLYGDYPDMHQEFFSALLATAPPEHTEIRVASNALGTTGLALVEQHLAAGRIRKHYQHSENIFKYPAMREMFYDEQDPIQTEYVVWLDDDSICNRNPNWLSILAREIVQAHPSENNYRMFGAIYFTNLKAGQQQWAAEGTWHTGRAWQNKRREETPNGDKIHFAAGGCWALHLPTAKVCDIPDRRLQNNGGDIVIGEQLWQHGYNVKKFNQTKQFVHTSKYKRRGVSQPHPGT